jgi:glutaconyl-CoA/methylmalonyl-CoA decarboxylase subunit gamma
MRYFVTIDGEEHTVVVSELPGGGYELGVLDSAGVVTPIPARITGTGGRMTASLGDRVFDLVLDGDLPELEVWVSGQRVSAHVESARMRAAAGLRGNGAEKSGVLTSPMPGKVVKLLVREGDTVEVGAPLVVVEAMKMENELGAPRAGVVQTVHVKPGDTVEGGAKLVTVA